MFRAGRRRGGGDHGALSLLQAFHFVTGQALVYPSLHPKPVGSTGDAKGRVFWARELDKVSALKPVGLFTNEFSGGLISNAWDEHWEARGLFWLRTATAKVCDKVWRGLRESVCCAAGVGEFFSSNLRSVLAEEGGAFDVGRRDSVCETAPPPTVVKEQTETLAATEQGSFSSHRSGAPLGRTTPVGRGPLSAEEVRKGRC